MKTQTAAPLNPIASALKCLLFTPLLFVSPSLWAAVELDGTSLSIDASTPVDDYSLKNGASLTAVNATTGLILATASSTLSLENTSVTSAQPGEPGVWLIQSTGTLLGGRVEGDIVGLFVGGVVAGDDAQADVTGTEITGKGFGALLARGRLSVTNGLLIGTDTGGAGSAGVGVGNGQLTLTDSEARGVNNGLFVQRETAASATDIVLDGSQITGQTGAAIFFDAPLAGISASTTLSIRNGSTLTSGNGILLNVLGNNTVDVDVSDSELTGDVVAADTAQLNLSLNAGATLTGRLTGLSSLTLNSTGRWNMVEDSEVAKLVMTGGSVRMGEAGAFYRLTLGELSGAGNFIMHTNFATGETDFLDITGTATGNHTLQVDSSGADPLADTSVHVVHAAAGDAAFSLLGGPVDRGTFSYELVQRGANDWYLDASKKILSPGTQATLALFNTASTVWTGELSPLLSRMGELRLAPQQAGGWIRSYGNRARVSTGSGVDYQQNQHGLALGADTPLPVGDGQWLGGVMAGYSTSDLDLKGGTSGSVDSYYAGLYTTWIDRESGYYIDAVLKLNRFRNESKVAMSDGSRAKGRYNNLGAGASVEAGKRFDLDRGWFAEPFLQVAGAVIEGKQYALDNGMEADGDRTRSLLGKVGTTVGRQIELAGGQVLQPYVRVAAVHEFAKNNEVRINNTTFNNDLSGSRGEIGAGVALALAEKWQLHANVDYSQGEKFDQLWGVNVGARYSW